MAQLSLPSPYSMCSEKECRERQNENQVSEWEATKDTVDCIPTRRKIDACLAVKKYRRSAAGSVRRHDPRSLKELHTTWKHLLTLFVSQQSTNMSCKKSLCDTASFLDDRIRALQVDLVLLQQASATLQMQLVRYQLLSSYLLSDVPRARYEPKFARQALQTALDSYWDDSVRSHDDEILCYSALCQVASVFIEQNKGGSNWQANFAGFGPILMLANRCHSFKDYPKFCYAIEICSAAVQGLHRKVLSLLSDGKNDPFSTLCRCCMAPALNVVRREALRHYNMAFGKRELISSKEMARLLLLPTPKSALDFCTALGLPLENDCLVMKASPVSDSVELTSSRKDQDPFILGHNECLYERVDEDGISIPPGLHAIIVANDSSLS